MSNCQRVVVFFAQKLRSSDAFGIRKQLGMSHISTTNCVPAWFFKAKGHRICGFQPSNIHGGLALANLWQSSGSMGVLRGYVSAVSLGADGPGEPSSLHTTMTGWC